MPLLMLVTLCLVYHSLNLTLFSFTSITMPLICSSTRLSLFFIMLTSAFKPLILAYCLLHSALPLVTFPFYQAITAALILIITCFLIFTIQSLSAFLITLIMIFYSRIAS